VVINMWWIYIVIPILMALGVYGFLAIVGVQTSWLTHKTDRRAEDMYDEFADPPGKRHRRS
jgi:hypothetical protein